MKKENNSTSDIRKGHSMMTFRKDLIECLENKYHTSFEDATPTEMYKAVATVVNQQLLAKRRGNIPDTSFIFHIVPSIPTASSRYCRETCLFCSRRAYTPE